MLRRRTDSDRHRESALGVVAPAALGGLLLTAGTAHFLVPRFFEPLIPPALGSARAWVLASGVAELFAGALVVSPRSRRVGGLAAAGVLVAVFPGNVWMAVDWTFLRPRPPAAQVLAWGRLPVQFPLIGVALRIARDADRPGAAS